MVKRIHSTEIKLFYKDGDYDFPLSELIEKLRVLADLPDIKGIRTQIIPSEEDDGTNFGKEIFLISLKLEQTAETFLKKILVQIKQSSPEEIIHILNAIDHDCCAYIRLDKDKYFKEQKIESITRGNCIHLRSKVAAYPAKLEFAQKSFKEFLIENNIFPKQ